MRGGVPIVGGVLAELRYRMALTQEDMAFTCTQREGVSLAREQVSRFERERIYPSPAKLNAMCAVLKVEAGSAVWNALIRTPTLDARLHAQRGEEDMDRHLFLRAVGAGGGAFLLGRAPRLDGAGLAALERQLQVTADGILAGLPIGVLLAQTIAHYDAALALMDASMLPSVRRRLNVLAGATATLAGASYWSSGLWGRAHHSFAVARHWGREAGHPGLEARALGALSDLHASTGRPSDLATAAGYADQAIALGAQGGMDANSRSWLLTSLAHAHAIRNDRRGFEARIERALGRLGGSDAADIGGRWTGAWGEHHIDRVRGLGLLQLGHPRQAREPLQRAVAGTRGRGQLRASIYLAEALVRTAEVEEACRLLGEAHGACVDQGYGRGVGLVHRTRRLIPDKALRVPSVRELDDRSGPAPAR